MRKSPQIANRTAVGEDREGRIVITVTEGGYTLSEFAGLLKTGPLGLTHAMSMDGGDEAELCVRVDNFAYTSYGHLGRDGRVAHPTNPTVPLPGGHRRGRAVTAFPCACGRRVGARRGAATSRRAGPAHFRSCARRAATGSTTTLGPASASPSSRAATTCFVLTRRHAPRRGYLDLPGGFLEAGRTSRRGARRELREETGLVVGRARPLGTYWDRYFLRGFGYIPTLNFYYLARWRSGEPRAADDAADANWMPLGALARPGLRLAWAHMREVFRDLRGMRRDSRTPPRAARLEPRRAGR